MQWLSRHAPDFWPRLQAAVAAGDTPAQVRESVREILDHVRREGDAALVAYTERFEKRRTTPAQFRVAPELLEAAVTHLEPALRERIEEAIANVRFFHEQGLPRSWRARNPHGALVGEIWYPLQRVGLYIPAGNVPLVSTVVMTATLAQLAGVPEIAVCTPAGPEGEISPQMLATLHLCGVREVYRLGGAQAIAALAYGTATVKPVVKILGPGNAYVAEAQRQVFGTVGIDLLPGPSEALLIADATAQVPWLAADLLAQAEHGSGQERLYYVFLDRAQAEAVAVEMSRQAQTLRHRQAVEKVLAERTLFIEVADLAQAAEVADFLAPEHLELHVAPEHYEFLSSRITTAGAILRGHETPTVLGDFTAGPSHTLPTSRTGRFFSGLKITDFMRRSSLVEYDRASLERAREVVRVFSQLESLDAHARSLEVRFDTPAS